MNRRILRSATAVLLALGLAACSSSSDINALQFLRGLPAASGAKAAPTQLTQEQIAQALAATDQSLILVGLEATQSQSLLVQIARNGAHVTYATPTRQSIVLRHGIVTGTRGLGGDLMSSDEDALLHSLQTGHGGSVTYVQRYLTPEDVTQSISANCQITRTPSAATAKCSAEGVEFTNTYTFGAHGQISSSRQWVGPTLGYISVAILRG